jgi:hypothetical protein
MINKLPRNDGTDVILGITANAICSAGGSGGGILNWTATISHTNLYTTLQWCLRLGLACVQVIVDEI